MGRCGLNQLIDKLNTWRQEVVVRNDTKAANGKLQIEINLKAAKISFIYQL